MLTKYYCELLKMISQSQISIVLHTFCVIFKCDKPSLSFHSSCSMSTPAPLFWVPLQSCWCDYRGWWLRLHNSIKLIYCPQHGGRRKSLSPFSFSLAALLLHASNISHLKLLLHTSTHIHPPPRQSIKVTSRGLRQTGSVEHCCGKKREANKPWPSITANLIKQEGWGPDRDSRAWGLCLAGEKVHSCRHGWVEGCGRNWPWLRSHEGPTGLAAGSEARHTVFVFCLSLLCLFSLSKKQRLALHDEKHWLLWCSPVGESCANFMHTHTILFGTRLIILSRKSQWAVCGEMQAKILNLDLFFVLLFR